MNDLSFEKNINGLYSDRMVSFWKSLKEGYDKFKNDFEELKIRVDKEGNYQFGNE